MSKQKIPPPERSSEIQGEGNYTAAKEYDDATRNFVKSGKVDKAAQDAKQETRRKNEKCSMRKKRAGHAASRK